MSFRNEHIFLAEGWFPEEQRCHDAENHSSVHFVARLYYQAKSSGQGFVGEVLSGCLSTARSVPSPHQVS